MVITAVADKGCVAGNGVSVATGAGGVTSKARAVTVAAWAVSAAA